MSRARNIKPGFFKNDLLVELAFEYRLLFVGLWTMADRDGRLEDRPTKIRMEVFPADAVDVDAGLQALHDNGFILRYVHEGVRYLQILAWDKHQNPHVKEAKSTIPAPCKPGASTVQAPAIPERAGLIPDSGFLIPDSSKEQKLSAHPSAARFGDWWAVYPKKIGKKPAEQKWRSRGLDAIADTLIADVLNRIANDDGWQRGYVPDPCTYLNQDRWGDEIRTAPVARVAPQQPGKQMQGVMALEEMKRGLVRNRNLDGAAEAGVLLLGSDSGG